MLIEIGKRYRFAAGLGRSRFEVGEVVSLDGPDAIDQDANLEAFVDLRVRDRILWCQARDVLCECLASESGT